MQRTRRTCLTKSGIVSEGATARPPAGALTEGLFKIDGTTAIGPIRSGTSFEGSIAAAGMNAPSGGFLGCGGESLMSAAHSTSVRLASSSLMAAWQLPWGKPQNGGDTGYILHFSKNSIPGITEFCGIGLAHGMPRVVLLASREIGKKRRAPLTFLSPRLGSRLSRVASPGGVQLFPSSPNLSAMIDFGPTPTGGPCLAFPATLNPYCQKQRSC